jgi:murein DD-endopeptidase MepM/ murein hydrolase activator NlpD
VGQHHKFQRALLLSPVAIVAVAAAVAAPLVLSHSNAATKTTSQSAKAINIVNTSAKSIPIEPENARRSYVAAASRSNTRIALAARVKAARARAAKAARALAMRQAKAREELRLERIKAAAVLLSQRRAQAQAQKIRLEKVRLQKIKFQQIHAAAVLLHQRQLQALEAQRLVASRAAQRARLARLTVKAKFNAARLGSPKAYAQSLIGTGKQYGCLVLLWNRESGWNYRADNPSSSAYGIPQALPGSKMASAGADWRTNPATQIRWGLGYIRARYGTPCGAWAHSQSSGWY